MIGKGRVSWLPKDDVRRRDPASLSRSRFQIGYWMVENRLVADVQSSAAKKVYLRADSGMPWKPVAQVLSTLGAAKPPISVELVTSPAK